MKKIFKILLFIIVFIILILFVAKFLYKNEYINIINKECSEYNIDEYVILSVIKAESNFKPDAVSPKDAIGLMQLTLDTANWCAEKLNINDVQKSDLYVPEINIKLGVYYFNYLLDKYDDFNTAVAAYNAGMGNVDKWLNDSNYSNDGKKLIKTPYNETNSYITKINNNIKIYKFLYKELNL